MARQSKSRIWSGWLARYKLAAQGGSAVVAYELMATAYDTVSFSLALLFLGPFWGAAAASALSLILNMVLYWSYDHLRVDWFKAQMLKELASKENKSNLERFLTWHHSQSKHFRERLLRWLHFILLTIPLDPVVLAIYYRESHFDGISKRDWLMLVKATAASCFMWLLILEPLMILLKMAWQAIF